MYFVTISEVRARWSGHYLNGLKFPYLDHFIAPVQKKIETYREFEEKIQVRKIPASSLLELIICFRLGNKFCYYIMAVLSKNIRHGLKQPQDWPSGHSRLSSSHLDDAMHESLKKCRNCRQMIILEPGPRHRQRFRFTFIPGVGFPLEIFINSADYFSETQRICFSY